MFKESYFGDENSRAHKRFVKFAEKRAKFEGPFFGVDRVQKAYNKTISELLYGEELRHAAMKVPKMFTSPIPIVGYAEELMDRGIIDAEAARKMLSEPVVFLEEVDTWELAPKCNCLGISGHSSWCNAAPQVAPGEVAGSPAVAPHSRK